ncbi:MAG TPA: 8-amino-7-oxononanoate synthase [Pseudoxanthomonas sp.]|nr:8-amino-7-oxononanoate synthase [Pseudoxanthomonas sp.]
MNRPDLLERIQSQRKLRTAQGRTRVRRTITRRDGVKVEVNGRWLTEFAGNDYLGLSQQFEVLSALQDGAGRDGVGAGASHLISGHSAAHEGLEKDIAQWLGYPRALLFGSGFLANLAVQQALLEDGDVCVQDRLNHASLIDASRLAGCKLRRYPHLDPEGALRQLKQSPEGAAMLATDGVFSMDGDVAPLRALSLVARMQQALLYVDDAHGVGVRGPDGRGSVAEARMGVEDVPLQLVTLGKALGGYGAVVVGSDALIQHLSETARPYLYTTALPPAQAAATRVAVKHAQRDHWRREKLQTLIDRFRSAAQGRGLELMASDTPIQPVLCGDEANALALASALESAGFWVPAIRPPTVPDGKARLRITLTTLHSPQQVDALVDVLARSWEAIRRIRGAA